MNQLKDINRNPGFTLIEALVAILVFTSALIIFGTMLSRGLSSIANARAELRAYLFAEEGIEAVHQVRDTNRNGGNDWFDTINQCSTAQGCMVTSLEPEVVLTPCPSNGCTVIGDTGNLFDQSGAGTSTGFTRSIVIDRALGVSNEATITAAVSWIDNVGRERTTLVQAVIRDW